MAWTNLLKPGVVEEINESGYAGSQGFSSAIAWVQSFLNTSVNTLTSCRFYLAKHGSPTGNMFATLYAHSGTFGTNSKPTGSPLATSENVDVTQLLADSSPSNFRIINFNFTDLYEMTANTYYCIALNYTGGSVSNYVSFGYAVVSASQGNLSGSTNLSAWSTFAGVGAISYVNAEIDYTDIAKPKGAYTIPVGTATGLIMSPTYATAHAGGANYTNISKPSSGSWTNITKPT